MTDLEWLTCADPQQMLLHAADRAGDRKLRLFAVACCRRIWHLLTEAGGRKCVELAERFADGLADEAELGSSIRGIDCDPRNPETAAHLVAVPRYDRPSMLIRYCIVDLAQSEETVVRQVDEILASGRRFPPDVALKISRISMAVDPSGNARNQVALLRCILGAGFLQETIDPGLWQRNGDTVVKLAASIYENRAFDRMPDLANALEAAGCTDVEMLSHCREPGPHARGCWVVDLLLGKQ